MRGIVLCLALMVAKPAIAQPTEVPPDPSDDRVTLRPLALPRGVIEAQAQISWASGERFMTDPIDSAVFARGGLGPIELHGGAVFHTRYDRDANRPTLTRSVLVGADYLFTPLLTVGVEGRMLHPGGDLEQGFDLRADVTGKLVLARSVAIVGATGLAYAQRETRGQLMAADETSALIEGAVQVAPVRRLTLEAHVKGQIGLFGDLYDNVPRSAVGLAATGAVTRYLDVFATASMNVTPLDDESDERVVLAGVTYRHP